MVYQGILDRSPFTNGVRKNRRSLSVNDSEEISSSAPVCPSCRPVGPDSAKRVSDRLSLLFLRLISILPDDVLMDHEAKGSVGCLGGMGGFLLGLR